MDRGGEAMFDAIIVGARCGGSPTAMLIARQVHRVLVVDRATFPSDTISTHYTWQLGLACLKAGDCSTAYSILAAH
jgi:flavin-dependent dehydrogenase